MSKLKNLSKTELKFIADMLDFASSEFKNNSINDYFIPASEDNKKFMVEFSKNMLPDYEVDDEIDRIVEEKDEILVLDWMLMKYLSKRCKALSEK